MHYLHFFHPSVIVYSFIHLSLYSFIVRQQRIAFIFVSFKRFAAMAEQWSNVYLHACMYSENTRKEKTVINELRDS